MSERLFCLGRNNYIYYLTELVLDEKEYSDWFPERSLFCHTDR